MQDVSRQVNIHPSRPSLRGKRDSISDRLRDGLDGLDGEHALGVVLGSGELKGGRKGGREGGMEGG
jgi:hypothetical protein